MDRDNIFKSVWTDHVKYPTKQKCEECLQVIKTKEVKYATDTGYKCFDCFNGK